MKKLLVFLFTIVFTVQTLACPTGDERGRPYFEIWSEDFSEKTMFYQLEKYFLRRERNMNTGDFSIREVYSFPIRSPFSSDVYGYTPSGELDIPTDVTVWEYDFFLTVGLENTFEALKEYEANELFYNVKVNRLHDCFDSEYINRARERLDEGHFTMVLPQIIKVEAETVAHDVFTEIDNDKSTSVEEFFDPITIQIIGHELMETHALVAINLDLELQDMEKIPVRLQGNPLIDDYDIWYVPYTIDIKESGTYAFVRNDFLFPPRPEPPPPTEAEILPEEIENQGNANYYFLLVIPVTFAIAAIIYFDFKRVTKNQTSKRKGKRRKLGTVK